MRAVRLMAAEGQPELVVEQTPIPEPGTGEALVEVHAAAITRDELTWPTDRLPAIPSYELSGVVSALGADTEGLSVGDAVYALTPFDRDGVAADYASVPAELLAPRPRNLDDVAAAAVPLPAMSAWQGLFEHGRLSAGERVLIHGAGGGVGHYATQLARIRGAYVIGTASGGRLELARELGAHQVIDHARTRFEDAIDPVDVVLDTAGGERLLRSPGVLRPGGRLVSVAEEPPAAGDSIAVTYFVVEPSRAQLIEIGALIDRGELRPELDHVYPLAEAPAAFERAHSKLTRGKVVLRVMAGG
jgi:NADPH:quinone reductase-like Zn-dependent oxidoreductase